MLNDENQKQGQAQGAELASLLISKRVLDFNLERAGHTLTKLMAAYTVSENCAVSSQAEKLDISAAVLELTEMVEIVSTVKSGNK